MNCFSTFSSKLNSPSNVATNIIFGGYTYQIFTTTGLNTITFNQDRDIEYLIVAGGGAGGCNHGGGGGAGEVIKGSTTVSANSTYNIYVGGGGTITYSTPVGTTTSVRDGSDSYIEFPTTTRITCKGGGRGGGNYTGIGNNGSGLPGGSGGGGAGATHSPIGAASTKNAGLGNPGGSGNPTSGGGGGGGAGGIGGNSPNGNAVSNSVGGLGGLGTSTYSVWINAITTRMNTIVTNWSSKTTGGFIASGGAGGSWGKPSVVTAYPGGGGDGGTDGSGNNIQPKAGTPNTGGGGGGGGSNLQLGANGGSGLVVVRYLSYYEDFTTIREINYYSTVGSYPNTIYYFGFENSNYNLFIYPISFYSSNNNTWYLSNDSSFNYATINSKIDSFGAENSTYFKNTPMQYLSTNSRVFNIFYFSGRSNNTYLYTNIYINPQGTYTVSFATSFHDKGGGISNDTIAYFNLKVMLGDSYIIFNNTNTTYASSGNVTLSAYSRNSGGISGTSTLMINNPAIIALVGSLVFITLTFTGMTVGAKELRFGANTVNALLNGFAISQIDVKMV